MNGAGGSPKVDLNARFDKLWADDEPAKPAKPTEPVKTEPRAASTWLRSSGIWPLALEKVKLHAPEVQAEVDRLLVSRGLPEPQWRAPPALRAPSDSSHSHPLSYLRLEDGTRLFMTSSLAAGSFGKFRLGLWESPSHPSGGVVVALKELRLSHWSDYTDLRGKLPRTLATSVREAKQELELLTASYSPLTVHGIVEHEGKLLVATTLLREDLYEVAKSSDLYRHSSMAERGELALHIAHDGAEALARLHAAGVMHRDIKAENVMYGPDNRVRVVDLGLAAKVGSSQAHHTVVGSPGYIAPEVLQYGEPEPRSDSWSLMVTVLTVALRRDVFAVSSKYPLGEASVADYRKFHQKLPRDRKGHIEVASAIAAGHPKWSKLFERVRGLGEPLADFVLNKGLHPKVKHRASAAEIQEFARQLLESRGVDVQAGSDLLRQIAAAKDTFGVSRQQLEAFAEVIKSRR